MRILNIISNQLIIKKQILEGELERTLNMTTIGVEEKSDLVKKIVSQLTEVSSSILTWESYINKEQPKQN
tara:strand:+ start:528 stop:737 length:210 start_codon:yes stop_codon:yes gene_type:complete